MRDLTKNPYSKDEQRVVDYFQERAVINLDDPIGFLIEHHKIRDRQVVDMLGLKSFAKELQSICDRIVEFKE